MIFGAASDVTRLPDTLEEVELTAYMMRAWACFVRDPREGLGKEMGWPVFGEGGKGLVRLGGEERAGAEVSDGEVCGRGCDGG